MLLRKKLFNLTSTYKTTLSSHIKNEYKCSSYMVFYYINSIHLSSHYKNYYTQLECSCNINTSNSCINIIFYSSILLCKLNYTTCNISISFIHNVHYIHIVSFIQKFNAFLFLFGEYRLMMYFNFLVSVILYIISENTNNEVKTDRGGEVRRKSQKCWYQRDKSLFLGIDVLIHYFKEYRYGIGIQQTGGEVRRKSQSRWYQWVSPCFLGHNFEGMNYVK